VAKLAEALLKNSTLNELNRHSERSRLPSLHVISSSPSVR